MKQFYIFFLLLFSIAFIEYSCAKIDTTALGSDLIPVVDNVNTFDTTLEVISDNDFLADTTAITYSENHALGTINDPNFGSTKATIYNEIVSPSYGTSHPFTSKDSVKAIDSVVLMLSYSSVYGDTLTPLNVTVSEIDPAADFKDSIAGYRISSPELPLTGPQLANTSVDITRLNDSIYAPFMTDTAKIFSVMRIRLNVSLGQKLAGFDTVAGAAYNNDSTFRTKFKGLAIAATAGQALVYFNMQAANSKLIVYYRGQKGGNADSAQRTNFTFAPYMQINTVKRTPGGAYASNMSNANPNDPYLYIQSAPGSYASLKIPGLKGLGNRVVHRAELIVQRDAATTSLNETLIPPQLLFLDAVDSANSNRIITIPNYDFRSDNGSYNILEFGGLLRPADDTYRFTLTRYVQGVLTRNEQLYTLRLHAPYYHTPYYKDAQYGYIRYPFGVNQQIGAGRVVLGGGSYPDTAKRLRLRIIYSKI